LHAKICEESLVCQASWKKLAVTLTKGGLTATPL